MVLPDDGVGLPEGAAMDWAHLQSVQSPYAVRLQREAQREAAVDKEEDDNIDERARVLREVNRFTTNRALPQYYASTQGIIQTDC